MEALTQYWPILITAVASVVWLVRLEGKLIYIEKMVEMQQEEIDKLNDVRELVTQIKNDIEWLKKAIEKRYKLKD